MDNFPQELSELVVDRIAWIRDERERTLALAATALTARRFRYAAHSHLFSTVVVHAKWNDSPPDPLLRLHQLSRLIDADKRPEDEGITSLIQSFVLKLSSVRTAVEILHSLVLLRVLKKIHRTGNKPRSLAIMVTCTTDGLDWTMIRTKTRIAILDLCRAPHLKVLRLRGFKNVPFSLLNNSSVDDVGFFQVSLQDVRPALFKLQELSGGDEPSPKDDESPQIPTSAEETTSTPSLFSDSTLQDDNTITFYSDLVQPRSLTTDHHFPIQNILDQSPTLSYAPKVMFKHLTSLTSMLRDLKGLEQTAIIIDAAPTIQKLELQSIGKVYITFLIEILFTSLTQCTGFFPNLLQIISHIRRPPQLRQLRVVQHDFILTKPSAPIAHSVLLDVVQLLSHLVVCPTLKVLSVSLSLQIPRQFPRWSTTSKCGVHVGEVFAYFVMTPLDDIFCEALTHGTRTFNVALEVNIIGGPPNVLDKSAFIFEAEQYVSRNTFPRIREKMAVVGGAELEVSITLVYPRFNMLGLVR